MCVISKPAKSDVSAARESREWGTDAIHEVSAYVAENAEEDLDEATIDVVVGGYQDWLVRNGFYIVDLKGE
ncbi:MAG: hypothetical protein COA42_15405 [Alteromonadaceae bacterium]|nr:MAG: hypothetical protein COA42_15405 [Alteromonadaceae bacterium]